MLNRTTALLSAILITTVAYGGEVYKWKDKGGQIHFGDSPFQGKIQNPEKVKLTGTSVTAAQRKEAEDMVARDRLQGVAKPTATPVASPVASPGVPTVSTQTSPNISPSRMRNNECKEAWRKYKESQDCFAQYGLAGGGVNGVAFQHCTDVRQPAKFCD